MSTTKTIPQRIRDAKANPNHVALRDAGLIDTEGVITRTGRFVLNAYLLDKFEGELVKLAKEHLADREATTTK